MLPVFVGEWLGKGKECVEVVLTELEEVRLVLAKNPFDICRGTIAQADPDDLGWKSENETSLMKIGALRHDDEAVIAGIFPNYGVIGVSQTYEPHVS